MRSTTNLGTDGMHALGMLYLRNGTFTLGDLTAEGVPAKDQKVIYPTKATKGNLDSILGQQSRPIDEELQTFPIYSSYIYQEVPCEFFENVYLLSFGPNEHTVSDLFENLRKPLERTLLESHRQTAELDEIIEKLGTRGTYEFLREKSNQADICSPEETIAYHQIGQIQIISKRDGKTILYYASFSNGPFEPFEPRPLMRSTLEHMGYLFSDSNYARTLMNLGERCNQAVSNK